MIFQFNRITIIKPEYIYWEALNLLFIFSGKINENLFFANEPQRTIHVFNKINHLFVAQIVQALSHSLPARLNDNFFFKKKKGKLENPVLI